MDPFPIRRSWLYRLTIPWLWLAVALVSWRYPGDEYGLFVIANGLPGAWLSLWLHFSGSPDDIFPTVLAVSGGSVFVVAWVMDRLRVPSWLLLTLWLTGAIVLFKMAYDPFESHARAMAKNGSLTAYVSAASNLGLFLACIGAVMLTGGYRIAIRSLAARPQVNRTPLTSIQSAPSRRDTASS